MTKPLHIIGAGGSAVEIQWAAFLNGLSVAGFYVEDGYLEESPNETRLIADIDDPNQVNMIISIADPKTRARIAKKYGRAKFITIIHPTAIFPRGPLAGYGTYIGANVTISPDVVIGSHVQIHNGAIIGHNTRIADGVTILPGAIIAGDCFVGYKAMVGAGASVKEKLIVGAESVIAMGAVVIQDVEEGATVAGVPAKPMVRTI
jgi:sugar O-acyltransferase (sialic acid O-acetyltransferase NeuD family)